MKRKRSIIYLKNNFGNISYITVPFSLENCDEYHLKNFLISYFGFSKDWLNNSKLLIIKQLKDEIVFYIESIDKQNKNIYILKEKEYEFKT